MPITQSRILDLLRTCEDYASLYTNTRNLIIQQYQEGLRSKDWEHVANEMFALSVRLHPDPLSTEIYTREKEHFRLTKSRNDRAKARAEHRRKARHVELDSMGNPLDGGPMPVRNRPKGGAAGPKDTSPQSDTTSETDLTAELSTHTEPLEI